MPLLSSAWRAIRTISFLATLYKKWLNYREKKASQKQKENINENPYDAFSDEFGDSAGSVQFSASKQDKLPTNADKS